MPLGIPLGLFFLILFPVPRLGLRQCRALTAVACVAKTAEAKFEKYYPAFIPGIQAIVTATAPKAGTDPQVRLHKY